MRWMHLDGYGGRILNCVTWKMWCLFFVRQYMETSGWYMWSNVVCENSVQRKLGRLKKIVPPAEGKGKPCHCHCPGVLVDMSSLPTCHNPRGHQFWFHTTRAPEPIPQAPAVKLRQDRITSGWMLAILGALMCFVKSFNLRSTQVTWPLYHAIPIASHCCPPFTSDSQPSISLNMWLILVRPFSASTWILLIYVFCQNSNSGVGHKLVAHDFSNIWVCLKMLMMIIESLTQFMAFNDMLWPFWWKSDDKARDFGDGSMAAASTGQPCANSFCLGNFQGCFDGNLSTNDTFSR